MSKPLFLPLLFLLAAAWGALDAHAAMIPQEWSVEVSRIKQYQFQANRGDTMELKATFWHKGEPFDLGGDTFRLYWQTNGMDSVYWSVPAVSASNTVSAVFANTMDPGAPIVYGFLGATSGNYRASFAIRYAPGPGAVPNALPLPAKSIDFAQVEVFNAPWLLPGATNDIGSIKVELGSLSNSVSTLSDSISSLTDTTASLSDSISTLNDTKASKADATLTPIYSDTPTFSEWTISPQADITLGYVDDVPPFWQAYSDAWGDWVRVEAPEDATELSFTGLDDVAYTATRTRTDIIGYTLGSQTDKPLASEAEAAANRAAIATLNDSISTLNDTKASKADATLTERGFSEWAYTGVPDGGVVLSIHDPIPGESPWILSFYLAGTTFQIYGSTDDHSATTCLFAEPDVAQITATRTVLQGYQLGTQADKPLASEAEAAANRAAIATINLKIPSAASASNQLADKEWIDDEIDTYAAYYITYTAAGAAFPTRAALTNATVVYSGGAVRTPTRNDYAVVLADESHSGAEWRYIYTVAAGATSGQWDAQYPIETNDYDGLSNKPQINGVSLTGNKTGADLSLQDALTTQQLANIAAVPNKANNSDVVHTTGDETIGGNKTFTGVNTVIPFISAGQGAIQIGLSGRISQVTADGLLDDTFVPNYGEVKSAITAAISPTDSAFSNAVLSVGLGIDTNTVAQINALVEQGEELPVGSAATVGGLLLALAAAVAALKKRLPYALVTKTIENGAVTLDDRASNAVEISATLSPNTLTINFPAATSGKVRDFALRLNIASGVTAPELVLPQGVVCENADGEVPEISDGGTGGSSTILYFSETENDGTTAKFLLKGETLAAITQA